MKLFIIPALALFAVAPTLAHAGDSSTQRFEHNGSIYRYTVTTVGKGRVISGVEEKSGKKFRLRVGARTVRGTVGSKQVIFALRDVVPLEKAATTLATR